jgi:MarR family transcriptional regulator, organic hydroperoxide resistance regulator
MAPRRSATQKKIDYSLVDEFAGHLTRVVQVRLFQLYYERLNRLGVSPGVFGVLTALRSNPGIPHGSLSDMLAVHGPNITKLVDRLVRQGWVERRKLPEDRRTTGHFLTPRGQAKADAILKAGLAHDKRATSALSAKERATLLRLLAKLDRALMAGSRPA